MAKYTNADCRLCRREGCKLFLKGDKCYSAKCIISKRPNVPGQHGAGRKKKTSEYSLQLREKQKAKRFYGLLENQFKKYYLEGERMKGITGENMLMLLETRLDSIVYKLGFGSSRAQARQIVNHAHITVNGKCVNIPSYNVKKGDVIAVKENKADSKLFTEIKGVEPSNLPKWLEYDKDKMVGKVIDLPKREDIDLSINEQLIIELYSR